MTQLAWRTDSRAVTFEYNQRGHQLYRVLELDAATGRTRTLVEETSKTFVEYSGKRYRRDLADGKEIIWASERDGWNHLYLYDGATGQVKNQITKGDWVVRGVEPDGVDETTRTIWFRASGLHAGKDPYFIQYYRVNFDGTGLTALTDADGTHAVTFSPDKQFYVDAWQRVDLPPQSVLKRDERSVGRDGSGEGRRRRTAGHRLAHAGSLHIQGARRRDRHLGHHHSADQLRSRQEVSGDRKHLRRAAGFVRPEDLQHPEPACRRIAELGFIVVQIDGMGTSNRSKAFHEWAGRTWATPASPIASSGTRPSPRSTRTTTSRASASTAGRPAGRTRPARCCSIPSSTRSPCRTRGCHDNRMDKIWWNEQWMGWPIGPHYGESSNVDNAHKLQGKLMLIVRRLDTNVDPASTMQVVDALIRANKTFEFVMVPGANHGAGGQFSTRKRNDWFVKNLLGFEPPNWNIVAPPTAGNGLDADEPDYFELERAPFFRERDKF